MDITSLKYIVVDSTKHACGLTSTMLFDLSARNVHAFTSSAEAWKEITRGPVGCLIVEHDLGGESGFDLIKRIRNHDYEKLREIPIILLTATRSQAAIFGGRDLGADEIIAKPFATNDLKKRLEAITQKRREFVRADGVYSGPDRRRRADEDFQEERNRRSSKPEPAVEIDD